MSEKELKNNSPEEQDMSDIMDAMNAALEESAKEAEETVRSGESVAADYVFPELEEDSVEEVPLEMDAREMETVLMEQDLLDAEPEPTPEEKVEMLTQQVEADQVLIKKNRTTITALAYTAGAFALAFLLSVGALIGMLIQQKGNEDFAGLVVGKAYSSNISLADYSNLTYTDTYVAPTDADVQAEIESKLAGTAYEIKADVTDELVEGDIVTLTFDGYIDGEIYDSACAEDYALELGSDAFIPGFEDGLLGHKVGDNVTLELTFPDDYSSEELQGKDVRFEVEITAATRTTYAEVTDAIAAEVTENAYTTVTAWKAALLDEMTATAKEDAESAAKNEIWTTIAENTKLKKYPDSIYDHFVQRLDKQFSSYYSYYNVSTLEEFMTYNGMDLAEYIEDQIVYEYSIYTIAAQQGITIEDADYTEMLTNYGCDTKAALAEKIGVEEWELESSILYEKVSDYLYEVATVK